MKRMFAVAAVVAAALVALHHARAEVVTEPDAFEYQFVQAVADPSQEQIKGVNQLGAQGWSVSAPISRAGTTIGFLLVRRRR
ncbi:MAG: hypothetical protein ACXWLM_09885 [Myxococcales bacterium]